MKIGIIADIHVDVNDTQDEKIVDVLIEVIKEKSLDLLIIAGDISNDYQVTLGLVDEIEEKTDIKCLFVPGNHDLWNINHPEMIAKDIYDQYLHHESCLSKQPYILNEEYVVIGDIGWYDYSFAGDKFSLEEYTAGYYLERQWQDKNYINWQNTDCSMVEYFYDKLLQQVTSFSEKKIVFVTHMVTHPEFIVPLPNEMWQFFNAYLGSNRFKDLFTQNVKYVLFGHVHYRQDLLENGRHYFCRCLNYRSQWVNKNSAKDEIQKTLKILEL